MKITIRLFASYRDLVGRSEFDLELGEAASVADVLDHLKGLFPKLSERLGSNTLIALNAEYTSLANPVKDGDEMALFPPVSGG